MRIETYHSKAAQLLDRACEAHRTGKRGTADGLRREARALIAAGLEALELERIRLRELDAEAATQGARDDAYVDRLGVTAQPRDARGQFACPA